MHGPRLRPTFEIPVVGSRTEVMEKLLHEFNAHSKRPEFQMYGEYGELHLHKDETRLWSPHLSFYVHEHDGTSLIRGRFAPRLEVWTLVWIAYLFMAFSAFFGLVFAYSQWILGNHAWGLWVTAVAMMLLVVIYVVADVGQKWSSDQMHHLRERLDELLKRASVEANIR
ncbi:MAG: hypothetical protein R3C03_23340 [Pirellulaceae bacterium]